MAHFAAMSAIHAESVAPEPAAAPAAIPPAPELEMRHIAPEQWDRIVAAFDDTAQEQLWAFAAARWPGLGHEPIVFYEKDRPVGGALVMVQPLPLGLASVATSKWGPMLADRKRADSLVLYRAMIEALADEYATRRGMMLSLLPRPAFDAGEAELAELRAAGFAAGPQMPFPDRYLVDLWLSDAAQRKSLGQKWRYHLNKSEKAGLVFSRAGPERFAEFDALYGEMTARKRFADHSAYATVPGLMALEDPTLRPELFLVGHDGKVVAGAVIFKAGNVAVYLYGATSDAALPLRAGYFLHWHIIAWLRDNTNARWYDLGGTDGVQGLHQFKKGMVGDKGVIAPIPPIMLCARSWRARMIGGGAFRARELADRMRRRLEKRAPAGGGQGSEAGP